MATNLEIANSALIKLGQEKISTYPDTTTKRGITISEQFSKSLKKVLRDHNWNFASKRTKISVDEYDIEYTDVDTSGETFTKSKHGYVTGQKVQVSTTDTLPNPLVVSTDYYVIKSTVDKFKLATSLSNALAGTAINLTTQGAGTHTITAQDATPEFEYEYQFTMPSDYLKLIKATYDETGRDNADFKFEGGKLLSTDPVLFLNYVSLVTDPSYFPDDVSELLALAIAADCAYDLVQSKELALALTDKYNKALAEARYNDGVEGSSEPMQVDYYLRERE